MRLMRGTRTRDDLLRGERLERLFKDDDIKTEVQAVRQKLFEAFCSADPSDVKALQQIAYTNAALNMLIQSSGATIGAHKLEKAKEAE